MKIHRLSFYLLFAAFIWVAGCASPTPDPLAGWKVEIRNAPDAAIVRDYKRYVLTLPPKIQPSVRDYNIRFLEDGTGQHAIKIEIPYHGAYYEHVLIYNRNDERIKVITYSGGRYAS